MDLFCGRQTLWIKVDWIFRSAHVCWLHTTLEWEQHCQRHCPVLPVTHVICWNREDVEWAEYKSNNLGSIWCDHCARDT